MIRLLRSGDDEQLPPTPLTLSPPVPTCVLRENEAGREFVNDGRLLPNALQASALDTFLELMQCRHLHLPTRVQGLVDLRVSGAENGM